MKKKKNAVLVHASNNNFLNNCHIIDGNNNWSQLSFLEALYIKILEPEINDGLKVSKELDLFK